MEALAGGSKSILDYEDDENQVSLQSIKDRLFEGGRSRGSCLSGSNHSPTCRLNKAVIHESIYVYASNKQNGGLALAEKWRLTLVKPDRSQTTQSKQPRPRKKSIITGVDTSGLHGASPQLSGTPPTYDVRGLVEESKDGVEE